MYNGSNMDYDSNMDYLNSMIVNPNTKPTHFYSKPIDTLTPKSSETLLKDLSDAIQYNENRIKEITAEYNTIYAQFTNETVRTRKQRLHEGMQELSTEKIRLITHMRNLQDKLSGIQRAIHKYKYEPCNSSNKGPTVRFPSGGTKKRRRIKTKRRKKSNKKKSNKKKRNNRTYRR